MKYKTDIDHREQPSYQGKIKAINKGNRKLTLPFDERFIPTKLYAWNSALIQHKYFQIQPCHPCARIYRPWIGHENQHFRENQP